MYAYILPSFLALATAKTIWEICLHEPNNEIR